jgi:hypothetical protein
MIWLTMMLQAAIAPLAPPAPIPSTPAPSVSASTPQGNDIVVVARNGQAELEACVARDCPPDQEIKAALVVASRAFLAGDYSGARHVLLKTRGRTAKFDAAYPVAVSDLHRALNTMGNLDGRPDAARMSAFDATAALRAGLKPDDPLILLQRLDTANQLTRDARIIAARQIYDDVIKRAAKAGYPGVEAEAMFQAATLYTTLSSINPDYRGEAAKRVARLEQRGEPEFAPYRQGIALVKLQLDASKVSAMERATMLAQAKPLATRDAFLLSEPETAFSVSNKTLAGVSGGGGSDKPEWADVAFTVQPDGTVGDVSVIAQSEVKPGSWLPLKTKAVAGRRYAPFTGAPLYRVERYTMVYDFSSITETRIKSRSARGVLNTTDVTAAHQAPGA